MPPKKCSSTYVQIRERDFSFIQFFLGKKHIKALFHLIPLQMTACCSHGLSEIFLQKSSLEKHFRDLFESYETRKSQTTKPKIQMWREWDKLAVEKIRVPSCVHFVLLRRLICLCCNMISLFCRDFADFRRNLEKYRKSSVNCRA